jgi:hypothetical protein
MLRSIVATCVLALCCAPATLARMYQWHEGANGTVQLSGEPPSWYRSGRVGPRVLVFDGGFLVDDTSIDVSVLRRVALRKHAFDEVEERRALADLKALQEAEERELRARARAARLAKRREATRARQATSAEPESEEIALPEALGQAGIARLKAIITAFDQQLPK